VQDLPASRGVPPDPVGHARSGDAGTEAGSPRRVHAPRSRARAAGGFPMRLRHVTKRPRARAARLADVPRGGTVGLARPVRPEASGSKMDQEWATALAPEIGREIDNFEAEMQ